MTKLIKLASKFELKLAQQKSLEGLTDEEKAQHKKYREGADIVDERQKTEINEKIKQMMEGPEGPDRDMGAAMKDWMAKHPNFTNEQIDSAADQWQKEHILPQTVDPTEERRKKLWKEFCDQRGIKKGDPFTQEIWNEWAEVQKEDNKIQEMQAGFDAQDKEVQDFMDKEKADKLSRQKNIEGKTPFMIQDATKIINASVNEMKSYIQNTLKQKLQGNQKIVFTFYPNGNVGISGQDLKIVNAIRRGFVLKLQLDLRGYITNYKKYFTGPVNYELLI